MARTREPAARAEAWRVFSWDPDAAEGDAFSASWVPPYQGQGRFDLPGAPGAVIYLAETPEHAVAEMLQQYRGQRLDEADLRVAGHRLALVRVVVPPRVAGRIVDLCDPEELSRLRIRPDETASANRQATQRIAARIHAAGSPGLRWWSALAGDWHTIVLFLDRLEDSLRDEMPELLDFEHPAVAEAMRALGIAAV